MSPVGTGSVGGAGFARAVGTALTFAEEVGERHVSLGRDVREGMSPVEIGPGIEVEAKGVEKKEEQMDKEKEKEYEGSHILMTVGGNDGLIDIDIPPVMRRNTSYNVSITHISCSYQPSSRHYIIIVLFTLYHTNSKLVASIIHRQDHRTHASTATNP